MFITINSTPADIIINDDMVPNPLGNGSTTWGYDTDSTTMTAATGFSIDLYSTYSARIIRSGHFDFSVAAGDCR